MGDKNRQQMKSVTESFEKKGGYTPKGGPVAKLPQAPAGKAPTARPQSSSGNSGKKD